MSNLLSNQKFIHSVSPLVASNGHKLPTENLVYKGEPVWAYILHNIKNNMWYVGISTQSPEDYQTSSNNKELMIAMSKGEITRRIIKVGHNLEQMKKFESDLINDTNADKDPMSYNLSRGIVSKKVVREPRLDMMKQAADQILEHRTLEGCKFVNVSLDNEKNIKNDKGYFVEGSYLNDIKSFQIREKDLDHNHVDALIEKIDSALGNLKVVEETTKQKFLVVILRDRMVRGEDVDLRIGGKHTFHAIEKSKNCFTMPTLNIPKSVHSDWTDEEIRALGEYLNPVNSVLTLQSSEDDIIKTGVVLANQFGSDSDSIAQHLNNHNLSSKQRTRIRTNITTQYNKQKELQEQPKNFIVYENSTDTRIQSMVDQLKKDYHTYVSVLSSGKLSVGDVVQRAVKEIKDGKNNIKRIKLVVYHPTQSAKNTFDTKWKSMIDAWDWAVDKEKIESITYIEMPHLKEEI